MLKVGRRVPRSYKITNTRSLHSLIIRLLCILKHQPQIHRLVQPQAILGRKDQAELEPSNELFPELFLRL